jgi:phospholipid/cholesterol/gamma-HCH transport system substrate-binding protein
MKYRSLELKVGATVFIAVLIFTLGLMWFGGFKIGKDTYIVRATFPMVGGINRGDVVNVNGVEKGEVDRVDLGKKDVVVSMKIDAGTIIPEDSKVILQAHGLLGERIILIIKGSSEKTIQEGAMLEGVYEPGIAETFASLGDVLKDLKDISRDMGKIAQILTEEDQFKKTIENLAVITDELRALISATAPDLKKSAAAFRSSTVKIDAILEENSDEIKRVIAGLDSAVGRMPVVIGRVDTLTALLVDISERLKSRDSTLGALLDNREFLDHLQSAVVELEKLVADIKKNPKKYLTVEIF